MTDKYYIGPILLLRSSDIVVDYDFIACDNTACSHYETRLSDSANFCHICGSEVRKTKSRKAIQGGNIIDSNKTPECKDLDLITKNYFNMLHGHTYRKIVDGNNVYYDVYALKDIYLHDMVDDVIRDDDHQSVVVFKDKSHDDYQSIVVSEFNETLGESLKRILDSLDSGDILIRHGGYTTT